MQIPQLFGGKVVLSTSTQKQKAGDKTIKINAIKINNTIQKAVCAALKESNKKKACFRNTTQIHDKVESLPD